MSLNSVKSSSRWSARSRKPLLLQQVLELRELGLGTRGLDELRLCRQAPQLPHLIAHPLGASGERHCLDQRLEPLALALLPLLQLFGIGEVRRARRASASARFTPSSRRRARFSNERRIA